MLTATGAEWTAPELYDRLFNLRQARYVARGYAATANLAVRRSAFERVGAFDASLRSSGDKEWNGRAAALDVPIAYVEAMRVRHPARASFEALAAKRARVAGGKTALRRRQGLRARLSLLRFALPSASAVRRILAEPGLTRRCVSTSSGSTGASSAPRSPRAGRSSPAPRHRAAEPDGRGPRMASHTGSG